MTVALLSTLMAAAASTDWSYVTAAYVLTVMALVAYAAWVILRGRKVSRQLPPKDRRWM